MTIYCVGLTGSLASGKSIAAHCFMEVGIEVIQADQVAKMLYQKDGPAYEALLAYFGPEIVLAHGEVDRKRLRECIFADPEKRRWLEQLLHPMVRHRIAARVQACTTPYCVVEIPLLVDLENYPYMQRILLIEAALEEQIIRVMHRDNCDRTQALAILEAQPHQDVRRVYAQDCIVNDRDLASFQEAVLVKHAFYLSEAEQIT